jgi:beta-lactamase regulating signal transducer with metallopeptidase domain
MLGAIEWLNHWGASWTTLVGVALWQSTLVACVVGIAVFALRRSSPAVRYWLWQLVAIKLLIVPVGTWSIGLPWLPAQGGLESDVVAVGSAGAPESVSSAQTTIEPLVSTAAEVPMAESPAPPVATRPNSRAIVNATITPDVEPASPIAALTWQGWLLVAWAVGVGLQMMRLLGQRWKLSRLLGATSAGSAELADVVAQVAKQIGLRRLPEVRITELDCSPLVCGIVRPRLVFPRDLLPRLDAGELRQVLAHELAHLKRRDLLWGWISELARTLYFFHPAMLWAAYQVRLERELACDAVAMQTSGRTAAQYAETLVRVLSAASTPAAFRTAAASLDGGESPTTGEERTT